MKLTKVEFTITYYADASRPKMIERARDFIYEDIRELAESYDETDSCITEEIVDGSPYMIDESLRKIEETISEDGYELQLEEEPDH